jgi:2-dehydropantoate 2-reductase
VKFVVLGAGAIGAFVGASLCRNGTDVTLVARGEHLDAMRQHGVRVCSDRGDFEARPPVTDDWGIVESADVVFVGLKAYTLPEVAPRLGELLRPGTAVIAAQNGIPWWYFQKHGGPLDGLILESVDPGGVITRSLPPDAAIGCVVYCSASIIEPGVIQHHEGTRFSLGEPDRTESERSRLISASFRGAGLKAPVERDLRNEIWLKLLGNATFNPLSAITGATLRQLGSTIEMRQTLHTAFIEITTLAERIGVRLPISPERRLEAGLGVGDHKTSMLQDLENGKPLEYQCMTGAVLELAQHLGVPMPCLTTIHACVRSIDELRSQHRQSVRNSV